jgi:hypothetical protein
MLLGAVVNTSLLLCSALHILGATSGLAGAGFGHGGVLVLVVLDIRTSWTGRWYHMTGSASFRA